MSNTITIERNARRTKYFSMDMLKAHILRENRDDIGRVERIAWAGDIYDPGGRRVHAIAKKYRKVSQPQ